MVERQSVSLFNLKLVQIHWILLEMRSIYAIIIIVITIAIAIANLIFFSFILLFSSLLFSIIIQSSNLKQFDQFIDIQREEEGGGVRIVDLF